MMFLDVFEPSLKCVTAMAHAASPELGPAKLSFGDKLQTTEFQDFGFLLRDNGLTVQLIKSQMLASQLQQQLETCACRDGFLSVCLAASHTMKFSPLGSRRALDYHLMKTNDTKWPMLLISSLLCYCCYLKL